jgi:glycosyltransferase involved in cell wall biosynthesis
MQNAQDRMAHQGQLNWLVLTASYPPDQGGIADHSMMLARALAQSGDSVQVWTGPAESIALEDEQGRDFPVQRLPTHFGLRSWPILSSALRQMAEPRRVLLHYNPQPFGPRRSSRFKGVPWTLCPWLRRQSLAPVWTIVHETGTAVKSESDWSLRLLRAISENMLRSVLGASERVFYVMPAAEIHLRQHTDPARLIYLPVPSNLPVSVDGAAVVRARTRLLGHSGHRWLLGHFGAFSPNLMGYLSDLIRRVLNDEPDAKVALIGQGSSEFATRLPNYDKRVVATGSLSRQEAAAHIAACDVLMQPFPDGVTTRRSSLMAGLALGVPIVSNEGANTEEFWRETRAIELVPIDHFSTRVADLLRDRARRAALSSAALRLYRERFAIDHLVATLKAQPRT